MLEMYTNWCYLYHIFIQTLDFFNLNTFLARTHTLGVRDAVASLDHKKIYIMCKLYISLQASMQEYRLRLLLLDRLQPTTSPPPTYRSNAGSIAAPATTRESRPPSYCAETNVTPNATLVPSKKDANLVRIVQTESEPVILSGDQTPPITAVEVLAHL